MKSYPIVKHFFTNFKHGTMYFRVISSNFFFNRVSENNKRKKKKKKLKA